MDQLMVPQLASGELTGSVQRWLLGLARQSISACLNQREYPAPSEVPPPAQRAGGCFVSLHRSTGELRGCIGTFAAQHPLWQNVREMSVAAATRDPRFPSITLAELEDCLLEISALTPPTPGSPDEVEVGRHGLQISARGRRGVLLPQVAATRGWDRATFLSQTCVKAGLPADLWREGEVTLELFEAQVFAEE